MGVFGFLNRDAISDQNMPFFRTFIRSRGSLGSHARFQTIMVKIRFSDQKGSKTLVFGVAPTYS